VEQHSKYSPGLICRGRFDEAIGVCGAVEIIEIVEIKMKL
jgi:hypothetical protein